STADRGRGWERAPPRRLFPQAQREADDELAALARPVALRLDPAAVQLDEAAHQRQAEPEAALRTDARALHLGEGLEDLRQHLRGDADAGVAHPDRPLVALGAHGQRQ